MLSDSRPGSIEQDADIVMFIDRSMDEIEAESEDRPRLRSAELIVAKHRTYHFTTRDILLANAEGHPLHGLLTIRAWAAICKAPC